MKAILSFFLITWSLSPQVFAGAKVKDLAFECTGILKIQKVLKNHFSPELPPNGRFPGAPANGHVEVTVEITSLQSVGCDLLTSKYKLNLGQSFIGTVGVKNPQSLSDVQSVGSFSVGKYVHFKTVQFFRYVSKAKNVEAYLPLHPEVVSEELAFSGAVDTLDNKLNVSLPIDTQAIYNTTPVGQWSEDKRIKLASQLIFVSGSPASKIDLNEFDDLFLDLQFTSTAAKKQHFQQVWKVLNLASNGGVWTDFFNFQTGGPGAFVGKPYAIKLIQLANEVATKDQIQALAHDYPTLLRADWIGDTCLNFSEAEYAGILQKWKESQGSFLNQHLSHIQTILEITAGDSNFGNDECLKPLRTPAIKAQSADLLQVIKGS